MAAQPRSSLTLESQIFRKEHFFRGTDNDDQLLKILQTLGTERFDAYLAKYGIHFETELEDLLARWRRFAYDPKTLSS